MAFRQHGLSRTLPKNFIFSATDEKSPKTPERDLFPSDVPPPPPRASSGRARSCRVRSGTDIFARADLDPFVSRNTLSDIAIPSIEIPPPDHTWATPFSEDPMPATNDHLLAPPRPRLILKTPPAQLGPDPAVAPACDIWSPDEALRDVRTLRRRGSACSIASNSSASSIETSATRPSIGGSCTSPESDIHDPFLEFPFPWKYQQRAESASCVSRSREKLPRGGSGPQRERWTSEMDNHLWNTYQLYLQNPTITPFKMTPGSIPPLGVTHRVARQAKKTWNRRRAKSPMRLPKPFRSQSTSAALELGTDRDASWPGGRSGSTTPKGTIESRKPVWPKSDTSTRRRLKLLCKRKFSIAPHYQRMMISRSPSPFMDLFTQPLRGTARMEAWNTGTAAYATRDLGVSLVSSSVPDTLAQLSRPESSAAGFHETESCRNLIEDRTENGVRAATVGFPTPFTPTAIAPAHPPRLGSPFVYRTWGPESSRRKFHQSPMGRRDTFHADSRPRPAWQFDGSSGPPAHDGASQLRPRTAHGESDADNRLEELMRHGKMDASGKRRVRIRNRGATVSAVHARKIDQLFSPLSPWQSSTRPEEPIPTQPPVTHGLLSVSGDAIKRLGSPFKLDSLGFPRPSTMPSPRHASSLSDPFTSRLTPVNGPTLPQPSGSVDHSRPSSSALPYDPIEEGISDAERIRRQILNLARTRRP